MSQERGQERGQERERSDFRHRQPRGQPAGWPSTRPGATTVERPAAEVAVALAQLRCLGQTVAQIGEACQLAAEQLARAEARDILECRARLPVEHVCGPAFAPLDEWFALLRDDLSLGMSLAGLDPTIDPDEPPVEAVLEAEAELAAGPGAAFAEFCERAQRIAATQGEDIVVDVRVRVAKRHALAAVGRLVAHRPEYLGSAEAAAHTTVAVYYQAAALNASLSLRALAALEAQGIIRADGRLVIAVCDADGYLAGLALEVIGAGMPNALDWLSVSRAAWRAFLARSEAVRGLRDEEGNWAGAPRVLTPEHLHLAPRAPGLSSGLEATRACLTQARSELSAAYLASAVQGDLDHGLDLRFAGTRPASALVEPDFGLIAGHGGQSGGTLARLAGWAYRDASSEKLTIARECLARELPAGEAVTLDALEHAAVPALEAAKANFLLYVRRNIEQYFKVRQAAQDAVAAYGATVRKAVSDLTGDLVENLYRTVGVLAAALLAGLLQPAVSLGIVRLATAIYALYMGFLLAVTLRAAHDRYRLERDALADRLASMPELSETERARLGTPARSADAHFQRYFWIALGIYAGLGALSLLFFILLWTPLAPMLTLPHAQLPR